DYRPKRPKNPALVVVSGGGDTYGEDHLSTVLVDVGGEEGDPLPIGGGLDRRDQTVELFRGLVGATVGEERIQSLELDEADAGDAMLRVGHAGRQVLSELRGDEPGGID